MSYTSRTSKALSASIEQNVNVGQNTNASSRMNGRTRGQAESGEFYLELFQFSAVGYGEGVIVRRKAERQPRDQAVHQLSELCEGGTRKPFAEHETTSRQYISRRI